LPAPPPVLGSGSSTGSVTPASQNAIPANDLNVNAVVAPTNDLIGQMPHVTNPDAMVADLLRTHASSPSLPQADSLSLHAELAGMNFASATVGDVLVNPEPASVLIWLGIGGVAAWMACSRRYAPVTALR